MGKRSRLSATHATRKDSASEWDDSDYELQAQSSRDLPPRRKVRKKNKNTRKPESDEHEVSQKRELNLEDSTFSHCKSSHTIQSPGLVRAALLRWYTGVYASRGMPWRKPFNPSQGLEERGQRAYEVDLPMQTPRLDRVKLCHRYGYPKLCFSKHKWLRLSPTMTDGCRGLSFLRP